MPDDRLWAPWRFKYIGGPKADGCILCEKPAEGDDEATYIVHRGEACFVMLNAFPYNSGHLMVSPYEHKGAIEHLDADVVVELMQLTQRSVRALREVYGPEGFNIGINQGGAAGAGVEGHIHQHVVPRWERDTNFMTTIASARVLPQSLADSHRSLRERF